MRRLVALLALAAASSATAQVRPRPGALDPRVQSVDFADGQVVQLEGAPGFQLTVELSPDEKVQNVALGDSSAWQVSVNRRGDHLFIKPVQGDVATNMTVVTSVRVYNFDLLSMASPLPDMAYTVRFRFPSSAPEVAGSAASDEFVKLPPAVRYRISGDRTVRPGSVRDDGQNTYIEWPAESSLPAVYIIGDAGQEILADGMMRNDVMVIDRVVRKLVFRMDDRLATAERVVRRRRK